MYCNYTYIPGASASNIKADLIKLVTANSATDNTALLANLSASCDKNITTITRASNTASGWSTGIGDLALVSGLAIDEVSYTINMPANLRWTDVAYINGSKTYYLVGKAGISGASTNVIYSTKDFVSFTSITLPYTASWRRVIAFYNYLAIYAGGDESPGEMDNTFVYKAITDLDAENTSWTVSTLPVTTSIKYFASSVISGERKAILLTPVSSSTVYSHYNNAAAGTPHIFNSTNGISWVQLTGAALTAPSTAIPGAVGATPGVPIGDWYTNIAVATQYLTPAYALTDLTAPIFMSFGGNNGVYTTASSKIITSTDGSSWYQHNTPSLTGTGGTALSTYWTGVAYGEGIFVAVQGGQGYAFTSGNLINKAYFTKVDPSIINNGTNSGAQIWVATTLPSAFSLSCQITYHKGFFVILLGGDTTKSSTMFVGKYSAAANNINWEEKSLDITGNWARAYTHANLKELILLSGSRISITAKATEGLKVSLSDAAIYDSNIKAINTSTGTTTHKYANIAVAGGTLTLRSAESLAASTVTNLIYGSDSSAYAQLLDLDSGGVVFVSCSSSHIAFFAYRSASSEFGSRLGGFCGVFEYSRDDAWSASSTSATSPYPTHCFFTSENKAKVHVARIKTSISSPDITDSSASLNLSTGISLDKKILNSSGTGLAHIASDIRANNSADFTYSVLGGILKGIKATTRLQGNTLEEAILDGVTYVIWEGGGVAASESKKERYLIEKA